MQIIDNLLSQEDFNNLHDTMMSNEFPWYWSWTKTRDPFDEGGDNCVHNCQLVHHYFRDFEKSTGYWYLIEPIVEYLNPTAFLRIKANLTLATPQIIETYMHTDFRPDEQGNWKTALFYLNTNDGYTKFIDGEVVQTIANRLVIFDGHTKHCGTTHTNTKFRTVINFNYYPCL